jgi:hypothetical protein
MRPQRSRLDSRMKPGGIDALVELLVEVVPLNLLL